MITDLDTTRCPFKVAAKEPQVDHRKRTQAVCRFQRLIRPGDHRASLHVLNFRNHNADSASSLLSLKQNDQTIII